MNHLRIAYCSLILVLLASVGSGCTLMPFQVTQPTYWPGDIWRTSTPEEQGLDSESILGMLDEIQNQDLAIHSLLIVRHGYLVTEIYYPPYQQETRHPVYSITKSFTSAMVGKALQEGYIQNLQQKVLEFYPDIAEDTTDPRRGEITLEHLLTMSAGYNTNTLPDLYGKDASFDTARNILTYNSVLVQPGTSFYYDSGLPHLLSAIVQKSTGKTLRDYAEQELFRPMGITDYTWDSDPSGITNGATNLTLRPRDMAKFGYLYLHQGNWNETQLLPEEWVKASTSKHIETKGLMNAAEDDGYGYLWWTDSFGGFSAHGYGGQYIFVVPALDMVIVFTSGLPVSLFPTPNQLIRNYLLPGAKTTGTLPANPQAVQALADRIQVIEEGVPSEAALPEIARQISGKTFQITQKPYAGMYDAITLIFADGDTYQYEVEWPGDQKISVTGSLKHGFHLNQATFPASPPVDLLIPLRGRWQDETTFTQEYIQDLNSDIELVTEKFSFSGDTVTIEATLGVSLESVLVSGEMVR